MHRLNQGPVKGGLAGPLNWPVKITLKYVFHENSELQRIYLAVLAPFPLEPEMGSSDWQTEPVTGVFRSRYRSRRIGSLIC
jgi:hypothetical protein